MYMFSLLIRNVGGDAHLDQLIYKISFRMNAGVIGGFIVKALRNQSLDFVIFIRIVRKCGIGQNKKAAPRCG